MEKATPILTLTDRWAEPEGFLVCSVREVGELGSALVFCYCVLSA